MAGRGHRGFSFRITFRGVAEHRPDLGHDRVAKSKGLGRSPYWTRRMRGLVLLGDFKLYPDQAASKGINQRGTRDMYYTSIAALALIVHLIMNYSAIRNRHYRNTMPPGKAYRWFILSVMAFYFFDALWGVLYDQHMSAAVFADTVFYFIAMTATVFLWTRYVISYLQVKNWLIKAQKSFGWIYVAFVSIVLILNFFIPIMFWLDENGVYHAGDLRYVTLVMQIVLFMVSAAYVLLTAKGKDQSTKRHHWAIGTFGITMSIMVVLQVLYPLLPMYSIGCLLGTCILHTFVLEDMKEDRRLELEEMVRREEEHKRELGSARQLAYRDPLTGVKNKLVFAEWKEKINENIKNGEQEPFAVVVCDINGLKQVNDQYGHKEGDHCIQKACEKICHIFDHSPVFRMGGDEFVILLSGTDYSHRKDLMGQINAVPRDRSKIRIGETVSAGIAEYNKDRHASLTDVMEEADKAMYERKQYLKETLFNEDKPADSSPDSDYIPVIHARKHILIADDVESNREILGDLLGEDYDISYAADGIEALEVLRSHKDEIDLVLLDLIMPGMDGRKVIAEIQVDDDLMHIPVIILTVDEQAELDCLKSGAMDFIPKPYPDIEIIKARISKCIELSEDRELIRHTERDKLTGLLNRDYFFRYVSRLDHLYKERSLDAVVCDVNHFHATNKQYGRQFCDSALHSIGSSMKKLARKTGGISCRESGDTFFLYCPHQDNYKELIQEFLSDVYSLKDLEDKITLRFGIFTDAQRKTDVVERFDCAKIAADKVKNDLQTLFGFYDGQD